MPGDYIVRVGEYADKMYFIKEGEVEILATDNKTRIGILRSGAYFGEIGLLLTQKRTVTVRALTLCIFETINKKYFDIVMDVFPHQKDFLLQVAQQRMKVKNPEDLEDESDSVI
jgi:ATP-binding cassette subfamily B protein